MVQWCCGDIMYDFIIVGAGLYGKILAYILSLNKYKILLIDKKRTDKNKLDNMVITINDYKNLTNLLNIDLNKFKIKEIHNIKLNNELVNVNNIILNIKKLENHLLELYTKNKGKLLDRSKIQKYDYKKNQIIILGKKYKYKNLIGADGTLSEVRLNLTHRVQKFKFIMKVKNKKRSEEFILEYNQKLKTITKIIPTRGNNTILISNYSKKNRVFDNYTTIKRKYNYPDSKKNGYFIPVGDCLFNVSNIYFVGDASGIVDPLTNTSLKYNIMYLKELINHFIDNKKPDFIRIKKEIFIKKILKCLVYKPIINKLILVFIKRKYKEDLC